MRSLSPCDTAGASGSTISSEMMAAIVAKRLVSHLERSGFVVMKRPPLNGSAPRPPVSPVREAPEESERDS